MFSIVVSLPAITQIAFPWLLFPAASMWARPWTPMIVSRLVDQAQTSPRYLRLPRASISIVYPGWAAAIAWHGVRYRWPGPTRKMRAGAAVAIAPVVEASARRASARRASAGGASAAARVTPDRSKVD